MSIESALYMIMKNNVQISNTVESRIFPIGVPEDEPLPAIVYQLVSKPANYTLGGPSDLVESLFQLTCWATTQQKVISLAEIVRSALDGLNRFTTGGVYIQLVEIEDESDIPVIVPESRESDSYGRRMDLRIYHEII